MVDKKDRQTEKSFPMERGWAWKCEQGTLSSKMAHHLLTKR
jgi:hypothetical protein